MNRLKAIYRSWAIPCAGQQVYSPRHRAAWLEKLREAGVRRRAEQTSGSMALEEIASTALLSAACPDMATTDMQAQIAEAGNPLREESENAGVLRKTFGPAQLRL